MLLKLSFLDYYLRPLLGRILPPKIFVKIYTQNREKFLQSLATSLLEPFPITSFPTKIAELDFRNDLGNAAGLDKSGDLLPFNYLMGAGFAIVGTVLSRPHQGNLVSYGSQNYNPWTPLPASSSALNSLGLPSKGIEVALDNIKKFQDKFNPQNFPIGLSLMGHPLDDEEEKINGIIGCIKKAQGVVDFIELNESCPNVEHNSTLEQLTERVKRVQEQSMGLPLFIKFDFLDINNGTLEMLAELSVMGLSICNTQKNYDFFRQKLSPKDYKIFDFYTQNFSGGISGEVIRQYSFEHVQKTASYLKKKKLNLALMHIGGISNYSHIEESRQHAQLRQWYTGFMEAIVSQKMANVYKNILTKN